METQLPKKTIQINPDFLKLPMKGGRSRKQKDKNTEQKPIKIRTDNDKTIKRRAIHYIRKQQEERYKRLMKGVDEPTTEVRVEPTDPKKSFVDEFRSDFDESLSFLQKLADQNAQKKSMNQTLKQYPNAQPTSTLLNTPILNAVLDNPVAPPLKQIVTDIVSLEEPSVFQTPKPLVHAAPPPYGCLKTGRLPTYRTYKNMSGGGSPNLSVVPKPPTLISSSTSSNAVSLSPVVALSNAVSSSNAASLTNAASLNASEPLQVGGASKIGHLTPEQQRAELKHFLNRRKEEKQRVERVKHQRNLVKPHKKQKRTVLRTFRVGKSKHYPRVGVLIPNKTIRNQVLAKKQKIRETSIEDIRKHLIKKGLIRIGSSCPNDVLRKMYESSMLMCGEIQNHNPDNLLYNYLHNAI
jgi:hypothetical protein